jgi:hypothetical protein
MALLFKNTDAKVLDLGPNVGLLFIWIDVGSDKSFHLQVTLDE